MQNKIIVVGYFHDTARVIFRNECFVTQVLFHNIWEDKHFHSTINDSIRNYIRRISMSVGKIDGNDMIVDSLIRMEKKIDSLIERFTDPVEMSTNAMNQVLDK